MGVERAKRGWSMAYSQAGQGLVEYVLILVAAAVVILVILAATGMSLGNFLCRASTIVDASIACAQCEEGSQDVAGSIAPGESALLAYNLDAGGDLAAQLDTQATGVIHVFAFGPDGTDLTRDVNGVMTHIEVRAATSGWYEIRIRNQQVTWVRYRGRVDIRCS